MVGNRNTEASNDLSSIKRKLVWRMGLAGLMIVALLGGLALFDYMSATSDVEPAPQYTQPVPVPKKSVTQPVTPVEPVAELKDARKDAAPEATSAPVDKAAPKIEMPGRQEAASSPAPAKASGGVLRGGSGAVSSGGAVRSAEPRTQSAPAASRANDEAVQPPVTLSRFFPGFALQAGVFADPRRAEELHARLTLEGIPATIETRVQVGPFKTRQEADAAREKLKAMGVDTVLLPPAKGAKR